METVKARKLENGEEVKGVKVEVAPIFRSLVG
jgi:hypothetical protein